MTSAVIWSPYSFLPLVSSQLNKASTSQLSSQVLLEKSQCFLLFSGLFSWSSYNVVPKSDVLLQLSHTSVTETSGISRTACLHIPPSTLWPCGCVFHFSPINSQIIFCTTISITLSFSVLIAVCHFVFNATELLIILLISSHHFKFYSCLLKCLPSLPACYHLQIKSAFYSVI